MSALFDITALAISTRAPDEWLKRFSEFLAPYIDSGIWIRGWPEVSFWLRPPPNAVLPKGCVERLESTARKIRPDILKQMISGDLTHLYLVNRTDELRAFLWRSWEHSEFPLIIFPASCSPDAETAILLTADRGTAASYPTLDANTSWFATVNLEGIDARIVCFASKDVDRTESLRQAFHDCIVPTDRLDN